jgi:hypothetical protein
MAPSRPLPELCEDTVIDVLKGFCGDQVTELVSPSLEERVEPTEEMIRRGSAKLPDETSGLPDQTADVFPGGAHQQLAVVLAYVGAEEVETIVDVHDLGLLFGKS